MWHLIVMRRSVAILFAVLGLVLSRTAPAGAQLDFAGAGDGATHHTRVKLLLSAATVKPGDTIVAGVDLKMDAGWHTYWKNPGEAGTATKIDWTLPAGVSAGEIRWPLPHKLPPAEVATYGYEDEVMLLVPLTVAASVTPGPLTLSAKVSWLECRESCIPADDTVTAKIDAGAETQTSPEAVLIDTWKKKTPQPSGSLAFQAVWEKPAVGDTRSLLISHGPAAAEKSVQCSAVDFFPGASDNYEIEPAVEVLSALSSDIQLRKQVKKFSGDWPMQISGTVVFETGQGRSGYDVNLSVAEKVAAGTSGAATGPAAGTTAGTSPGATSLAPAVVDLAGTPMWQMLLYAFLGGLILNIMPCVLPVIALKILGFVNEAQSQPRHIRKLGLCYTLGVLASFLVLAGLVISFQTAGHQAGWGMQFGSPIFIVCLTTLVLLVALNLFGVFEVAVGGRAFDTASSLASKSGPAGAFFNGVLATTLATPCTAPFLAPALGFAFAQSAPVIVIFFLTVGLGLSLPYLVLSWQPAWLKFLPKPGGWMEKFKIAMGFPMLATVVWLFNIAASSYRSNVLWLGVFLVLVAFAAWIFGEFVQRGRQRKLLAGIATLLVLAGAYGFALEKELDWRAPAAGNGAGGGQATADGLDWQPWSPEAVAAARAAGKPVLVDFTADWCATCQFNKKTSIDVPAVRKKLKALDATTLVGDYTHFPEAITQELWRHHRAGVPLVLVYPAHAQVAEIVLPDGLLTPRIVLDALDGRTTPVQWGGIILWGGGAVGLVLLLAVYWRKQPAAAPTSVSRPS